MKSFVRVFSLLLTGIMLFIGLVFLLMSIGQYEVLQEFVNQFAPDGNLESFTASLHAQIRIPLLFFGSIFFILGGVSAIFRNQYKQSVEETFQWIPSFLQATWQDAKAFIKIVLPEKLAWWEWAGLILILVLAVAGRWTLIERPMAHDESYTFIAFARREFRYVISDYHLPNNHIFNSVLIHLVYKLFGNFSPAVVRFPAFLSGVLVCTSGYFFTRREYGKWEALSAGVFLAVLPWLKWESVNGRGYMLMALFTIWMLSLAIIVQRTRNRFAWFALILVSALNFWTVPVALYPFAIVVVWLLFSAVIGDIADQYDGLPNFLKYMIGYGVTTGGLTFLLYLPVFLIGSGWNSFFNNPFVSSLSWNDFRQTLPVRLVETWQVWTQDFPLVLTVFLVIGAVLYVVFHRKIVRFRVPVPPVVFLTLSAIFILQKPNPWPRIWTYLLPLAVIWSLMGWFAVIKRVFKAELRQKAVVVLSIILIVSLSVWGCVHIGQNLRYYQGDQGPEEVTTLWLKERLTEEDYLYTSISPGPAIWYYMDLYDMPVDTVLRLGVREWKNLYLLVDTRYDDSYLALFEQKELTTSDCLPESVELIYEYGPMLVYRCDNE